MTLKDLISNRGDLKDLREYFKALAKKNNLKVKDVLALAPKNDIAYITPSNLKKAKWFAKVWEKEGKPVIHPRGLHYRILGKGYKRPKGGDYVNTNACWNYMRDGTFYAQALGLVPYRKILDRKNPDPIITGRFISDKPYNPTKSITVLDRISAGYEGEHIPSKIYPPELGYDSADELINNEIDMLIEKAFTNVYYDAQAHQDYYIEIWAEKSGVIDEGLARKYGATTRPAGGGEMSYKMCRDAVERAKFRDQDLVVVMSTDFDPKGRDMPKSVARKIELEAALHDVDAHVHHATVTRDQVREYGLPGTPAKTPRGLENQNPGALSYETHKQIFREYAGQDPVEIQAFSGREPEAYRQALERYMKPYYDEELARKIHRAIAKAKKDAKVELRDELNKDKIEKKLRKTQNALDKFWDKTKSDFDKIESNLRNLKEMVSDIKEDTKISDKIKDLRDELDIDVKDVLSKVDLNLPTPKITKPPTPLLDTRRSLAEQIGEYKNFDIRYKTSQRS